MLNELKNEKNRFIFFFKKNRNLLLFIMGFTCLNYATKLFLYDYSVDTEQFIAQPDDVLRWWLRIGRYGLVFLKQFTMFGNSVNVTLINFMTYILLGINTFLLCYLVWRLDASFFEKKRKFFFISSALFISSPVIIEQTNFILQSVEVMLSVFFVFLAVLFIQLFVETQIKQFIGISCVLAWFSFAVYPSLVIAFILVSIMSITFSIKNTNLTFWDYFKSSLPYIFVCILSFLIYLIIEKIVLLAFNLKEASYLRDASGVGKESFDKFIERGKQDFFTYFVKADVFFMCIITFLLAFLLIAICIKKTSKSYKCWCILSLIGAFIFVISPLWLLGRIGPIRALFPAVPIALFFFSLWLLILIDTKKIIKTCMVIASIFIIVAQAKTTSDFGMTEYVLFEQEKALMNDIIYDLETTYDIHDFSNYKLVVIGKKEFDLGSNITGDVIGRSFYNWNYKHRGGCGKKVANFFYSQGIKIGYVKPEEFKKIEKDYQDMSKFPEEGSIIVQDNLIIIRF